ncbi:hypothetical protein DPMN_079193 [Dreissena polymorpha]|uniref:Uncharacterized protein n=1 Tax=Dreissena polymorpha TaxID=45954 RepID=A0A9D3YRV0_DREPO|nr:hypothetical protein DPMN_079193 [Dreissena polymorpha]
MKCDFYRDLDRDIIGTNLLTRFHKDRTKKCGLKSVYKPNVDDGRTDGRRAKTDHKSSPEQSGELTKKNNINFRKICVSTFQKHSCNLTYTITQTPIVTCIT